MIDDVVDLRVFVRVVATGSMSAAARDMDLSLAVISKRIGSLERKLGVRLMLRTTRSQSLTPEGVAFHERCARILQEIQGAEHLMAGSRDTVSGMLTLTAPRTFARQYLAPIVAAFQARHPALSINLKLSDDVMDLVESGIDVAFRFGTLHDSSLSARQIAPNYRVLCAAQSYVARNGAPTTPDELSQHACIVYGPRPAGHWLFQVNGQPLAVKIQGTFLVNDGDVAQSLALEGAGIFFKSVWDVGSHIQAGRLLHVMQDFAAPMEPLHVVFPHGRQLAPRVRQFIDFAVERLQDAWAHLLPEGTGRAGAIGQRDTKKPERCASGHA
ncbi:LysR family transcriptional regulator [Variovorax sp. W2I14]|uniref:LysR family transcriptional regulator n=1 Tax=Variovorax sp. W2I14 TaxID=3042290 RepID=UPI003D1D23EB